MKLKRIYSTNIDISINYEALILRHAAAPPTFEVSAPAPQPLLQYHPLFAAMMHQTVYIAHVALSV